MAVDLVSLDKLTNWEDYCAFLKERLMQLPDGENVFFVTKKKLDFVDGKRSFKGHAVLAGPKGLIVAKAMLKEGVQFHEGTCTRAGKELGVQGIEGTFLKEAERTLKRTRLGWKISGVEDDGTEDSDSDSSAGSAAEASAGEAGATTDPGLLERRLRALAEEIQRVTPTASKDAEPFLKQARERARKAAGLLVSDPVKAATLIQEGEEFSRQAQAMGGEGGTSSEAAEIEAERAELLEEVEEGRKLGEPTNAARLDQAEKALAGALAEVGKKDYARARAHLEAARVLLSLVVEGPDEAGDPDLTVLDDWKKYRSFLKAQLKRFPKEGGPVFISRKPQVFTIKGKEFKGHAILFGPKARASSAALRREGILFMEGTGKDDGMTLTIGAVKRSLFKGAVRTMIKLRLGRKLGQDGPLLPEEDETAESAEGFHTGKKSLDKELKDVAEALVQLRDGIEKQRKAVPGMKKAAADHRKAADTLTAKARAASDAGSDATKDWDEVLKATQKADAAHYEAKNAEREAGRAEASLREMTERLHRIKSSDDSNSEKSAQLKKLKAEIAAKQLDTQIANIDPADPKAGKLIADQIKKRFGVSFKLNESKITGVDKNGKQIIKDNVKKVDPKREAETLKELYLTLSKAPAFPSSHLKKLTVSLRPADSRSEGGVYYSDKSAEITCRRPKESFDYGRQLNGRDAFPGGVDDDCKAANADPVNYFDWATLHEVAHAVDAKHKFMDSRAKGAKYGTWIEYENDVKPIAKIVADHFGGGLGGPERKKLEDYAVKVMKAKSGGGPAHSTPEEKQVKDWVDAVRSNKGLWWDGTQSAALAIGNRVYQEAYDWGGGQWNSYALDARKKGIHGYQFRAPGEWFAELYAAYYSDKLKPSHPIVADLTGLEAPK